MPRATRPKPSLDPAIWKAERKAQEVLQAYLRRRHGIQRELSDKTGIHQAFLSRLANKENVAISLEVAMLIEVGTEGEMTVEQLCPARAFVLQNLTKFRAKAEA